MAFNEHAKRSLVKSVSFRVLVMISDFIIITAITRRYEVALVVIIASNLSSTVLYYLHERAWNKINWGKA